MQQRTKKSSHFQVTNCGQAKYEVQQRTKKSSHFQMTNCGEAKNEMQQRTKKSSLFQMINSGQAKPKCSNAPKNLVILKKQTVVKRNQSAAAQQKIKSFSNDKLWRSEKRSAATHQKI